MILPCHTAIYVKPRIPLCVLGRDSRRKELSSYSATVACYNFTVTQSLTSPYTSSRKCNMGQTGMLEIQLVRTASLRILNLRARWSTSVAVSSKRRLHEITITQRKRKVNVGTSFGR